METKFNGYRLIDSMLYVILDFNEQLFRTTMYAYIELLSIKGVDPLKKFLELFILITL